MPETIAVDHVGRVARITLNRPEKLNAISRELQRELVEALVEAERDDAIHVALVSGAGRAFSAGYDLVGGSGVAANQSSAISRDRDGLEELNRNWLRIWDLEIARRRQSARPLSGRRHATSHHLRRDLCRRQRSRRSAATAAGRRIRRVVLGLASRRKAREGVVLPGRQHDLGTRGGRNRAVQPLLTSR